MKEKATRIEPGHYKYRGFTVERIYHEGQGNAFFVFKDGKRINTHWPNRDCQPSFKKVFAEIDYSLRITS